MGCYLDIDEKIKKAIDIIDNKIIKKQFNYIYPYTTENINGYINLFDLKDHSLLTVGSSGDQVLNAIFSDCKDITILDICPFAREYYYLKVAAIKSLSYQDFFNFFSYGGSLLLFLKNKEAFNNQVFTKICENLRDLDFESSYFWSQLFDKYTGIEIRKNIFNPEEYRIKTLKRINRYLKNEENYCILKSKLDDVKVSFLYGDIFEVTLDKKYDNIFLSNIATYYKLDTFKKAFDNIIKILNNNGKMIVSYLYDTDLDDNKENTIYNKYEMLKVLSNDLVINSFMGIMGINSNSSGMTDSVITYKKVKKM